MLLLVDLAKIFEGVSHEIIMGMEAPKEEGVGNRVTLRLPIMYDETDQIGGTTTLLLSSLFNE